MEPRQLRALRGWFGWSQTELAARLGVQQNTVARWETGSRRPRGPAVKLLGQLWARMLREMIAASSPGNNEA